MRTSRRASHEDAVALLREVAPTHSDLLEARAYVLENLANGAALEREVVAGFLKRKDQTMPGAPEVSVDLADPDWRDVVLSAPSVIAVRLSEAVRSVISDLYREGAVAQLAAGERGDAGTTVQVRSSHGSSGTRSSGTVPHSGFSAFPEPGKRWALVVQQEHPRHVYGRAELAADFEDLLGPRGVEVLREALACFRSAHYLAAVDLLAAASEAAWHGVARAGRGQDDKLDRLVNAGTNAAEVIQRAHDLLARGKVIDKQQLNDVRAQAARFRDIRNYGLHPVGPHDADREDVFTEAGATVLFMTARRYFAILADAYDALSAADQATS
ncbi:hypothetical protein CIK76_13070 [Glutamicibacter sp. BW80]|uniref:hypothetical protein n=1 Tax=Glutamicibacter sp. BW80 TaxID=2024404 RepID=UPI000BB7C110|nr:hypothetical protein [Glutamicibacter sp. BW80]PCC28186.1 hypothetical protein CIK76_13070 [Glutamicibacter sp. BW80]